MSETPERIEREMFEIRSRMAPDVKDLKQHVDPKIVGEQVKDNLRQRAQDLWMRVKATVTSKQQEYTETLRSKQQEYTGVLKSKQQEYVGGLRSKQQEFVASAKRQADIAREAGSKRDPSALTDAVKSDPRPMALLAVLLAVTLLTVRKIFNGRD